MSLVEKNSEILYSKSDLISPTSTNVQSISWSQNLGKSMQDNFVTLHAQLASDGSAVVFFVQQSWASKLLNASTATGAENGDQYKVTVQPPNFRYGQDDAKNPTFRFLVYLDPSYKPYQHRFINQTTAAQVADMASKTPGFVPYSGIIKSAVNIGSSIFGDYLREF